MVRLKNRYMLGEIVPSEGAQIYEKVEEKKVYEDRLRKSIKDGVQEYYGDHGWALVHRTLRSNIQE